MFKHLAETVSSPSSPAQSGTSYSITDTTNSDELQMPSLPDGFDEAMHREVLQSFFAFFNPWCWWVDETRFRSEFGAIPIGYGVGVKSNTHTDFYSPLLHWAILAIGVMYLETDSYHDRALVANSFAGKAAAYFEKEIERPKLSTVVGLMLLGSHHAGDARQNSGFIYAGTGLRLTRIRE